MSAEAKAGWEKMKSLKQEESKYISESRRLENEWEQWMDELIVKYGVLFSPQSVI